MFKFGFLFEKKKECKNPTIVIKPELPVFEWQKVGETGLEETITQATTTLNQPEDVKVDTSRKNLRVNNNRSRSSSLNAESSRIRLMQIIEDDESRKIFRDYLVSQYCEENLDFYMDVANYREFFCTAGLDINEDMEEINSRAVYIWSEYLDDDTSPKSLNVPQDLVNTCRRKIEAKSHTIDVFDKLQEHCFGLMVQDSLPKFTRNSIIIDQCNSDNDNNNSSSNNNSSLSVSLNNNGSATFLKPPSFVNKSQNVPRKSPSSGSLRVKMISTIVALKTTSDLSLSTGKIITNIINHNNNMKLINTVVNNDKNDVDNSTATSPSHTLSPPLTPISPASTINSISTQENNTPSTTASTPTSLTSEKHEYDNFTLSPPSPSPSPSSSTNFTNNNASHQRISMASISNITRRILSRRRNSTSSNSSRLSIFDSNSSSNDKLSAMPGSYPFRSDENCIRENCELENESTSTDLVIWQKLRRNVSTPNFQQRHLTQHNLLYILDKNLPPIPVIGTRRRKES